MTDDRPGFDTVDLTRETVVHLAEYLAQLQVSLDRESNMFVKQALHLRISETEREIAIRNVRATNKAEADDRDAG